MLENLTKNQKIMVALLTIVAIIGIALAIYFGVSCKKCPKGNCKPPSLVRFSPLTGGTWPWTVETWYQYSYVDKKSGAEGDKSPINDDKDHPIKSTTATSPIIQVTPNPKYDINIYRAQDVGGGKQGDFELIKVTIAADGSFTDTYNPAKKPEGPPPRPSGPPVFKKWGGGSGPVTECPTPKSQHCQGTCKTGTSLCSSGLAECLSGNLTGGCNPPTFWENQDNGCPLYCVTP
jgi:hypothetical protein